MLSLMVGEDKEGGVVAQGNDYREDYTKKETFEKGMMKIFDNHAGRRTSLKYQRPPFE